MHSLTHHPFAENTLLLVSLPLTYCCSFLITHQYPLFLIAQAAFVFSFSTAPTALCRNSHVVISVL